MQFQKLSFRNVEGKLLSARLDLPADQKPKAFAIFAHCFTCTKNFNAVVNINRALAVHGIAVLRFDFTGLGESEGDFAETNFSTNVSDLVAAAEFLRENYQAPTLLVGHSLGGGAVLLAAGKIPSVLAVSTIAAPANPVNLVNLMNEDSRKRMEKEGEALINISGKDFRIRKQFLQDLQQNRIDDAVNSLRKPLLIFHSPVDGIVSIDNAARIFMAARHPKSFISLDTADHLLSNRGDSLYVGSVLASWAQRYLKLPEQSGMPSDDGKSQVVARIGRKGFQTEIVANGHSLIADEPIPVGGANTGPNPYDLLVSALGACTGMTLRMYADRKKIPLEAAVVRLTHRKIHAQDCAECAENTRTIDSIEREIELQGDLDGEARKRLLEIADRCPVHRTLQSKIQIETRLKE
ncbi:MAG: alpha/beta fold hydrolase [Desulfobacteraceae bacterium]|nr:alpha/beta fold hydrolase [Desulfobacteraceae bacterium]